MSSSSNGKLEAYRKGKGVDDDLAKKYGGGGKQPKKGQKPNSVSPVSSGTDGPSPNTSKDSSKKGKFVDLYTDEGREKVLRLPGRHKCDCQASKHKLINNCLKCGRIVCDQEGSGPCYFCSNLVCSREEQQVINAGGKKADNLYKTLMFKTFPGTDDDQSKKNKKEKDDETPNFSLSAISEEFKRAVADKDRLLEYQQNSARRTIVYDDQADYYSSSNIWLSPEDREKAKKRENDLLSMKSTPKSKSAIKITLDFAGRKVHEDEECSKSELEELEKFNSMSASLFGEQNNVRPNAAEHRPQYLTEYSKVSAAPLTEIADSLSNPIQSRIRDSTLAELQDSGNCLSMHQPYASLLVRGIKKFEGRSWYSNHRGILWIASTAKPASSDEIKELENFYRIIFEQNLPAPFPGQYPSSCLLGCVEVVDCLAQEQFREQYPDGESESPYVMVCRNPRELPMKFPISGKHKIYKLDPKIHQAAKKAVELSPSIVRH